MGVEVALFLAGRNLAFVALDLAFGLAKLLVHHLLLAEISDALGLEQRFLRGRGFGGFGDREVDAGWNVEVVLAVALGNQAAFLDREIGDLARRRRQTGARLGIVEVDEHVAFFDAIAVLDQNFCNNAAFEVLHALVVAVDGHRASSDDGARDWNDGGCHEPKAQQHNHAHAVVDPRIGGMPVAAFNGRWRESI